MDFLIRRIDDIENELSRRYLRHRCGEIRMQIRVGDRTGGIRLAVLDQNVECALSIARIKKRTAKIRRHNAPQHRGSHMLRIQTHIFENEACSVGRAEQIEFLIAELLSDDLEIVRGVLG